MFIPAAHSGNQRDRGLLSLCSLILLAACSTGSGGAEGHRFNIDTREGVPEAVSSAIPRFTEPLFTFEKVVELLGGDDPDAALNFPFAFTWDGEDAYYVCDTNNSRVVVFDASGGYVRSFGQNGQGPGDLYYPTDIVLQDGTLILPDRNRTSVFSTDGNLLSMRSNPQADFRVRAIWEAADGTRLIQSSIQERVDEESLYGSRIVRVTPQGDTLHVFSAGPAPISRMVMAKRRVYITSRDTYEEREMPTSTPIHYAGSATALWLPQTQEILISDGRRPVLDFYDLDGRLRRAFRLDLDPQPVSEEEKAEIVEEYDRQIEQATETGDERAGVPPAESARRAREILQLPETKGLLGPVIADDAGYLWVMHTMPAIVDYNRGRELTFRVFSPQGEYLGDSTWPRNNIGGRIIAGHLLLIPMDPETGEYVPTVYRMVPSAEGFVYP